MHAHAHLRVLGGINDTTDNLKEAVEGEGVEFKEMYPKFLAEAESEKNQGAAISISNAMAVERIHHGLYSEALESVSAGNDLPGALICVCGICGNTVVGEAPDKCPVCNAPKSQFSEVA